MTTPVRRNQGFQGKFFVGVVQFVTSTTVNELAELKSWACGIFGWIFARARSLPFDVSEDVLEGRHLD